MMIYAVGFIVAHRLLLAELKRRGVRRPHLVAGVAIATVQTARRVGTLVAENRRRANGSPWPDPLPTVNDGNVRCGCVQTANRRFCTAVMSGPVAGR